MINIKITGYNTDSTTINPNFINSDNINLVQLNFTNFFNNSNEEITFSISSPQQKQYILTTKKGLYKLVDNFNWKPGTYSIKFSDSDSYVHYTNFQILNGFYGRQSGKNTTTNVNLPLKKKRKFVDLVLDLSLNDFKFQLKSDPVHIQVNEIYDNRNKIIVQNKDDDEDYEFTSDFVSQTISVGSEFRFRDIYQAAKINYGVDDDNNSNLAFAESLGFMYFYIFLTGTILIQNGERKKDSSPLIRNFATSKKMSIPKNTTQTNFDYAIRYNNTDFNNNKSISSDTISGYSYFQKIASVSDSDILKSTSNFSYAAAASNQLYFRFKVKMRWNNQSTVSSYVYIIANDDGELGLYINPNAPGSDWITTDTNLSIDLSGFKTIEVPRLLNFERGRAEFPYLNTSFC